MFTATSPKHETTDFQLRRRRAAKLTQFFGVDYRDLIKDVLESIEKGVDEEQKRGTLKPGEAEVCLHSFFIASCSILNFTPGFATEGV